MNIPYSTVGRGILAVVATSVLFLSRTHAATLAVSGRLEGDAETLQFQGDTMDFYKFELLTTGTVRIEVPRLYGGIYFLAAFIGVENEFGFVGNAGPYRIETPPPCDFICTEPRVLERSLTAGVYVVATLAGGRSSYDVYDGYVAANREGGGFASAPYEYTINGDVRGVEYWDGHLDGTFTVTSIPEPGTASLIGGSALFLWQRNATNRKENKALQRTPRGWFVSTLSLIRKCLGFGGVHPRP